MNSNLKVTTLILSQLIHNDEYTRKVFPFIKAEYFENPIDKAIFRVIKTYLDKYNKRPTQDIILIEVKQADLNEDLFVSCKTLIDQLVPGENDDDLEWLIDTTEAWCKDQAIYGGLKKSLAIYQGDDKKNDRGAIVTILEDALSVSFDSHIGSDYLADAEERYERLHQNEPRISFDIDILNTITQGGLPDKTLSIFMGGVHVGKSQAMCHCAAANLMDGRNVLYITLEMSEDETMRRIDANLLDWPMNDLKKLPKDLYMSKIDRLRRKTPGRLMIKEYPTSGANVTHFRHLLHELRFKQKFKPDIIYLDYLNLCSSSRIRLGGGIGTYEYVMFITQEIRGFAIENRLPIVSATQLNREGFKTSDPGMEHTAESFGTNATADLMLVMIATQELIDAGQIMMKQIKNRFGDKNLNTRFVVGRDNPKMRWYNVENAQKIDINGITAHVFAAVNNTREIMADWT